MLTGQAETRFGELSLSAFPPFLSSLSAKLPAKHPCAKVDYIIAMHTAFPYYTYFDDDSFRKNTIARIASGAVGIEFTLGFSSFSCGHWSRHPQYCVECNRESIAAIGFPHFQVEHQLPGVLKCWKHDTVLVIGCNRCGSYPLAGQPLCMAGMCYCPNGAKPLRAFDVLPGPNKVLLWLAQESASMLSADSRDRRGLIQTIRHSICASNNLSFRGRISSEKLAAALADTYSADFLAYLGWPALLGGKPNPAWAAMVRPGRTTRCPSIVLLLLAGLICRSLHDLDTIGIVNKSASSQQRDQPTPKTHNPPKNDLATSLTLFPDSILAAARHCGVTVNKLLHLSIKSDIPIPLPNKMVVQLGTKKLLSIKSAIRAGVSGEEVKKRFDIGDWMLERIRASDPAIVKQGLQRRQDALRDKYRRRLLALKKRKSGLTRGELAKLDPVTCNFFHRRDKQWFDERLPMRNQSERNQLTKAKKELRDSQRSEAVLEAARELRKLGRRLTKTLLLTAAGVVKVNQNAAQLGPNTIEALEQTIESEEEYYRRKIKLVLFMRTDSHKPVTLTFLRSKIPQLVDDARDLIIKLLVELQTPVEGKLVAEVNAAKAKTS